MLPFQQSHDLGSQGFQIQDHLITDYDNLINFSIGTNDAQVTKTRDVKQKESSISKKAIHREVERKRRQEMSDLCASLRSLLPHHHTKGKLSVCDQIQAATSYIKRMEKKIEELKTCRNKLKSWLDSSGVGSSSGGDDAVTVNIVSDGMEILISHSIEGSDDLGLSRVLVELQRCELDVVSSVSTRIKDRFVHKILVKALDMAQLAGASALQERLSKTIK